MKTEKSPINKTIISGKRKTAVAKLTYAPGKGNVFYNYLPYQELNTFHRLAISEPLRIYEKNLGPLEHDLFIKVKGGGNEAQIQAARLAIARALVKITGSEVLRKAYLLYDRNMLVQDSRRKEASKPGDSAPRAKRQKSYR